VPEGWRLEEIVVLGLASNRLARAVAVDEITSPLRRGVRRWAAARPDDRLASKLAELLSCPVCTGWWTSLGVSLVAPGRARVRRGVAVAGVQVMLSLAERLVSERGREAIHDAETAELTSEGLREVAAEVGPAAVVSRA
jgi:hypothetical protein